MEKISRADPVVKACIAGSTAMGAASGLIVGSFAAPITLGASILPSWAVGAAYGFASGYLLCPYLAPLLAKRLGADEALDDFSLRSSVDAMKRYAEIDDDGDALLLLAISRAALRRQGPTRYCATPHDTAQKLLSSLSRKV